MAKLRDETPAQRRLRELKENLESAEQERLRKRQEEAAQAERERWEQLKQYPPTLDFLSWFTRNEPLERPLAKEKAAPTSTPLLELGTPTFDFLSGLSGLLAPQPTSRAVQPLETPLRQFSLPSIGLPQQKWPPAVADWLGNFINEWRRRNELAAQRLQTLAQGSPKAKEIIPEGGGGGGGGEPATPVNYLSQFFDYYQSGNKNGMFAAISGYVKDKAFDSDILTAMLAMATEKPEGGMTAYQSAQLEFQRQQEANRLRNQLAELQMSSAQLQGNAAQSMLQAYGQLGQYAVAPGQQYMIGQEPGGIISQLYAKLGLNYNPQPIQRISIPVNAPSQAIQPNILQALATQGQMVR